MCMADPANPEQSKREESNDAKSKKVWEPTIRAQQKGLELTPEQERALKIRSTSLSFVEALNQLIEDPHIKNDVVREAEAISQYWQALRKLQDLGITNNMHVGKPQKFFTNPNNVAEYMAGQLIEIEDDKLPNIKQALSQVKEPSEDPVRASEETGDFFMPTKYIPPTLENWLELRNIVRLTRMFLASDLDRSTPSKS
jgi:hypothetical protein